MGNKNILLFIVTAVVILCAYRIWNYPKTNEKQGTDIINIYNLNTSNSETVEDFVYKPFGFRIIGEHYNINVLQRIEPTDCTKVFEEWIEIGKNFNSSTIPPKEVPSDKYWLYTLNGFMKVVKSYRNEKYEKGKTKDTYGQKYWSKEAIEKLLHTDEPLKNPISYAGRGEAVYFATRYHNITGKEGFVIGSQRPWVEIFCLRNGAAKVSTVEYLQLEIDHPRMQYYNAYDMANDYENFLEKFDFAVSFSSLEHSGLGRYGDPLDPIGDFREMQKIRCQLKKGGLAFIGFPVGIDQLVFNLHRIYGKIRLPMMFEGFKLLDVFDGRISDPVYLKNSYLSQGSSSGAQQLLFVLQKT